MAHGELTYSADEWIDEKINKCNKTLKIKYELDKDVNTFNLSVSFTNYDDEIIYTLDNIRTLPKLNDQKFHPNYNHALQAIDSYVKSNLNRTSVPAASDVLRDATNLRHHSTQANPVEKVTAAATTSTAPSSTTIEANPPLSFGDDFDF